MADQAPAGNGESAAIFKPGKEQRREAAFAKSGRRYIALQLSYKGTNYEGFACNDDSTRTVEGQLFHALKKTSLIVDRESCQFSRCGRTDRGVSAAGQVVGVMVRSKLVPPGVEDSYAGHYGVDDELPYVRMLNGVLPEDIRVRKWADVPPSFSARFSCIGRTYKYFFALQGMDLVAMREAATNLVGEHDFRNFCKIDKNKPKQTFVRIIHSFTVEPVEPSLVEVGPHTMFCFHIRASAFLWHQVRAMAAMLFLVGQGKHKPEFVSHMLDVSACVTKPTYAIAPEGNLLLVSGTFPPGTFRWHDHDQEALRRLGISLTQQASAAAAMACVLRTICDESLQSTLPTEENGGGGAGVLGEAVAHHRPWDVAAAKRKQPEGEQDNTIETHKAAREEEGV